MKIMISQPMNGKTNDEIFNERAHIMNEIVTKGHIYVNTVFAEDSPKDCDTALYYLAKSIKAMSKVDAVLFMDNWEGARGCRIEHDICLAYGKEILYEGDL